jgi:hypothetical protein
MAGAMTDAFDLSKGAGSVRFSPAAGKFMPPTRARRISPSSPEGRAIIARLKS